jgi:predicted dehydrogenase
MATTVVDADRMIDAAQRAGRTLAVGHMWRHHPDVIALRERIADGEFGRIVRTHGWASMPAGDPRAGSPIRRSPGVAH